MSLILRDQCQELLNNVGLPMFHVEMSNSKHLQIVSRCGEPLVTISGIKFSKFQLTNKEIEIATKLFQEFLEVNKQKLEDYLVAYDYFYSLPKVEKVTKNFEVDLLHSWVKPPTIRVRSNGLPAIHINMDKKLGISSGIEWDRDVLISLLRSTIIDEAYDYLLQFKQYKEEEDKFLKAKAELNSCKI